MIKHIPRRTPHKSVHKILTIDSSPAGSQFTSPLNLFTTPTVNDTQDIRQLLLNTTDEHWNPFSLISCIVYRALLFSQEHTVLNPKEWFTDTEWEEHKVLLKRRLAGHNNINFFIDSFYIQNFTKGYSVFNGRGTHELTKWSAYVGIKQHLISRVISLPFEVQLKIPLALNSTEKEASYEAIKRSSMRIQMPPSELQHALYTQLTEPT